MQRFRFTLAVVLALLTAPSAHATPIEIDVDTAQSVINVQFCLGTNCDSDTSPVTGASAIRLDSVSSPTMFQLDDFFFALTETINIAITGLTATGTNITMDYATPGIPQPPVGLAGGMFTYLDVPANQTGIINYNATGSTCFLLIVAGYPCTGSVDLSAQGTQNGDFDGTVTLLPGRVVRLALETTIITPVNPDAPSLGTITISGTIVGQSAVPLRADADLNGTIDGRDVKAFTDVLLNPGAFGWQKQFATDMNDDDSFDLTDVVLFVDCLLNGNCAD